MTSSTAGAFRSSRFRSAGGLTGHVVETRAPLVISENLLERARELGAKPVGDASVSDAEEELSRRAHPQGRRALGVIALYSHEANAYSDSDVRLLRRSPTR